MAVAKKTKTRSHFKSIDDKYYGPEPINIDATDRSAVADALNWYNYMFTHTQAKMWLLEYMKKNNYSLQIIDQIKAAPEWQTVTTSGWMARMMMNGSVFNETQMTRFEDWIQRNALAGIKVEKTEPIKSAVTIQDRTQAKIYQLITDLEEAIDNDSKLDIYQWLTGKEATVQAANAIRAFYANHYLDHEPDEFDTSSVKKARAELKKYWEDFNNSVDRYLNNKKAVKIRSPRAKKVKSATEMIKNLKFQKQFPDLKIVSVNPIEIIGAQQLWVYNTKYKKLTQYVNQSPQGLQVKGTTLVGWDVEKSLTKSIRKPDVTIAELLKAGKVSIRTFLSHIKTNELKPNGRLNSDTVLLRVIK